MDEEGGVVGSSCKLGARSCVSAVTDLVAITEPEGNTKCIGTVDGSAGVELRQTNVTQHLGKLIGKKSLNFLG